ncbi:MAG: M48 family metalloprotease [Leptothrix sp. (in: b-proteobacteria)]
MAAPAAAEGILAVLARSHQLRLDDLHRRALDPAADPRAALLARDFERVLASESPRPDVQLLVVDGAVQAETLAGHVVVVSASLAVLADGERLFILAHELGHAQMGHWGELCAVYARFIPDEVTPEVTNAVAPQLGRAASTLVHGHEYAADAYAMRTIRTLGYGLDSAAGALHLMPNLGDSSTHPASRKRLARLQIMGDGEVRSAAVGPLSGD